MRYYINTYGNLHDNILGGVHMNKKISFIILFTLFILSIIIISIYINAKSEDKMLGKENVSKPNEYDLVNNNKEEIYMEIKHVNADNFENEVLKSNQIVIIDFYAEWCTPCQMLSKVIQDFANERNDIKVVKINIDEEERLATDYRVMSIPTLVVIKNGEEVNRSVGLIDKEKISDLIK